jgi:predicted DCC family thiol-disulfide oxidoreductase YuxK
MSTNTNTRNPAANYLLYDGDCPFCRNYVRYLIARDAFGGLELRDARQHPQDVHYWKTQGHDVNRGMILYVHGTAHFGEAALQTIAEATTPRSFLQRLNRWAFRSARRSHLLYPILRSIRNLTLRILGRTQL